MTTDLPICANSPDNGALMETLLAKLDRQSSTDKLNRQRRNASSKASAHKASAGWPRRSLDYTQPSEHAASDTNQGSMAPRVIASSRQGTAAAFVGKLRG